MNASAPYYDIAIAWTWQYDNDFVRSIRDSAAQLSLRVLEITKATVIEALELVRRRAVRFGYFLDRASDEDETFVPLVRLLQKRSHDAGGQESRTYIINSPDLVAKASDKATMHLEFLSNNVNVPYTIIVSPYNHRKEIELSLSELAKLGRPFIVKPANTTGGGVGVVTGAETLKDILEARQHHRNDKYLLQETIAPALVHAHRAWFRVFYVFGLVLPCWWDDRTHIYDLLGSDEERMYELQELRSVVERIHSVCQLDFFSTEIALTSDRRLVAVDYVNEMCDMRLQSKFPDGVPDGIIQQIAGKIVQHAAEHALQ